MSLPRLIQRSQARQPRSHASDMEGSVPTISPGAVGSSYGRRQETAGEIVEEDVPICRDGGRKKEIQRRVVQLRCVPPEFGEDEPQYGCSTCMCRSICLSLFRSRGSRGPLHPAFPSEPFMRTKRFCSSPSPGYEPLQDLSYRKTRYYSGLVSLRQGSGKPHLTSS